MNGGGRWKMERFRQLCSFWSDVHVSAGCNRKYILLFAYYPTHARSYILQQVHHQIILLSFLFLGTFRIYIFLRTHFLNTIHEH